MDITTSLISLGIDEVTAKTYAASLCKDGFDTPQLLSTITEKDLNECGITAKAHVRAILSQSTTNTTARTNTNDMPVAVAVFVEKPVIVNEMHREETPEERKRKRKERLERQQRTYDEYIATMKKDTSLPVLCCCYWTTWQRTVECTYRCYCASTLWSGICCIPCMLTTLVVTPPLFCYDVCCTPPWQKKGPQDYYPPWEDDVFEKHDDELSAVDYSQCFCNGLTRLLIPCMIAERP
jgi:hypothetical protein